MSAAAAVTAPAPAPPKVNYLNVSYGVKSWLLTTDHKRIALLYMGSITVMFALGGMFAAAIRLELVPRPATWCRPRPTTSRHPARVIMVFFFLIPSIPATLGNFLLPLMIGARDLAFPKLNLLSWYLFMIGAGFAAWSLISGGVDTGWTFYTPYSTAFSNTHVVAAAMGAFVAGFSSILTGLNFIVTIHKMRAPGLTWLRLPYRMVPLRHQHLMGLVTPVLAVTLRLVMVERG